MVEFILSFYECGVACQVKVALLFPKVRLVTTLTALHIKFCAYLCYCLLSPDLSNMRDIIKLNAFDLRLIINVYVVVQFYPLFEFYFPFFQTHYHTLQYPKTKEKKI